MTLEIIKAVGHEIVIPLFAGAIVELEQERKRLHEEIEALRTALAQPEKEWVGLTDAEAMEIEDKSPDIRWAIIQAEAKLKEKNT
jgi:hypothetical protein